VSGDSLVVAVLGCGSIGQRHLRNLAGLPGIASLLAVDPDMERREQAVAAVSAEPFESFDQALCRRPQAVVVATPTHLHLESVTKVVRAGCHIFVEKPIAMRSQGVAELLEDADRASLVVMVGYNLRFHPGLRELRALMEQGAIGRIIWVRAEYGWHLPNWRPDRDYRSTYSARRNEGGGVLLDGSHELDLLRYLLGEAEQVYCLARNTGTLGTDVEEVAALVAGFADGVMGEVHLDFLQRAYSRTCKVVGTEGTAIWEYVGEKLTVFRAQSDAWETQASPGFEPNHAYLAEMQEFLEAIRERRRPQPDGWQGLRTLDLAEAAARSTASGRRERLSERQQR